VTSVTSKLNESQTEAVLACLHKIHCNHKAAVELIWGPPGTGKTKTTIAPNEFNHCLDLINILHV
jgi:replication-associated recombination protein RarA